MLDIAERVCALNKQSSNMGTSGGHNPILPRYRINRYGEKGDGQVLGNGIGVAIQRNAHPSYDAYMRLELGRDIKESVAKVRMFNRHEIESVSFSCFYKTLRLKFYYDANLG
jgi:hypothetical protein